MTTTEPTTCTSCQRVYDAPIMVAAFDERRLCPECEKQAVLATRLHIMKLDRVKLVACLDDLDERIAAHKAAHPPLVKLGQGEYEREIRG